MFNLGVFNYVFVLTAGEKVTDTSTDLVSTGGLAPAPPRSEEHYETSTTGRAGDT